MTTTPESRLTRRAFVGCAGALAIGRFALRHPLPDTGIIKTELPDSRLFCTDWCRHRQQPVRRIICPDKLTGWRR